jgi:hypothetical protein
VTWEELRRRYVSMLSDKGLRPTIDSDGDILFRYDGRNYFITSNCDSGYFEILHAGFWEIEDQDELARAAAAASGATQKVKAAKVWVNSAQNNVSAQVQGFVTATSEVEDFLDRSLRLIKLAIETFRQEMNDRSPSKLSEDLCYLDVHVEETGFAAGKSVLRNLVGQSSVANWKFIGRITGGGLRDFADVYEGLFQTDYGRPIDMLSGIDREVAQDALNKMHRLIIEDGWRPTNPGPYWYSYRYVADRSILRKL